MLFRTISFQFFLGLFLLLLPAFFAVLVTVLDVPHSGPATTMLMASMSLHASLEFLGICYFVVPYRRATLKLIARMLNGNAKIGGFTKRDTSVTVFGAYK